MEEAAVEYFDGWVVGETRLEEGVLLLKAGKAVLEEEAKEGAVVGKAENLEPDRGGEMEEEETTDEEESEEENLG